MQKSSNTREIYIVITQTGTILSRIIKRITGAKYNHASISLTKDLDRMFSFGRLNPYNAFIGGYVMESPRFGTFKRFKNTDALVLAVEISEEQYDQMHEMVESMWKNRKHYHYNYMGLYLAAFKISRKKKNCFHCAEFVGHVLTSHNVSGSEKFGDILHPMDFLVVPHEVFYQGKLREYPHRVM